MPRRYRITVYDSRNACLILPFGEHAIAKTAFLVKKATLSIFYGIKKGLWVKRGLRFFVFQVFAIGL